MRGVGRTLLVGSLLALGGCGAFRASAGVCFGLGGSVRAGPVDVGILGGASLEWGNAYGAVGSHVTIDVGLAVARVEVLADGSTRRSRTDTSLPFRARGEGLVLDAAYPFIGRKRHDVRAYLVNRPSEIAVSLYALFFACHLGFDPLGLGREVRDFVRAAAGEDGPEPPEGSFPDAPSPEDGLEDPPYTIVHAEDFAALESGTVVERARALRDTDELLANPRALFCVRDDEEVEHDVQVREGLATLDLSREDWEKLVHRHDEDARAAFESAEAAADPEGLFEALGRFPLAPGATRAARVRAELLVERGDLGEALFALEDLASTAPELDDADRAAARRLLPGVRALAASLPPAPPAGEAWSGSAGLDGWFLGASGRAVWATTAGGDVAWERSDALAADLFARKVVGAISGIAIVEAIAQGRPWVLGLDSEGRLRWKTPLPAPAPGCGPMDQVYATDSGRVFVARTDGALALEARSGRVLWRHVRRAAPPEGRKLWKKAVPMDWRPPAGPERRRPDGPHGFHLELTPEALLLTSGPGRRVERLDARTGELLSEGD